MLHLEMNDTRPVEWATAIGTIAAVVVALFLAGLPAFRRWWRRPKLEIRFGEQEPHIRGLSEHDIRGHGGSHIGVVELRLRAEIHNAGKTEARRVRAQVTRWASDREGGPPGESQWVLYDTDPLPLRFIGAPRLAGDVNGPLLADLAPGASDYVDIVKFTKGSGDVDLIPPDDQPRPFRLKAHHHWVEYWVEIVVATENADVVRVGFYFTTSRDDIGGIVNVHSGDAPDVVIKAGYLNLWKGVVSEEEGPTG